MFERLWRSPLRRARQAARSQRWAEAAAAYRHHLARYPADAPAWTQLGHALKELDDLNGAAEAYRSATQAQPGLIDARVHLAHVERRCGHVGSAVSTLGQGLATVPNDSRLIAEMLALGAREHLPYAAQTLLEQREGSYAVSRYSAFRAAHPAPRLQDWAPEWQAFVPADVLAVIDARAVAPELVGATRETLAGMACFVMTESTATVDEALSRIGAGAVSHLLLVEGGTRLEPGTRDWLVAAATRTGVMGAFCDHDHWRSENHSIVRQAPCFQPMRDPLYLACADVLPPCVLLAGEAGQGAENLGDLFDRRMELAGAYAHVPLVLASRRAAQSAQSQVSVPAWAAPSPAGTALPIQVIIQTRDAPDLLERCVDTLRTTAARPDLLDVVVMDNRSVLPRTAELLAGWQAQGIARRIAHDEPFNWARANNLAAALGDAPLLLFLNNDVEMETPAWDTALRGYLADGNIGAIGARLLYPDRRIQHAGVIFGMDPDGAGGGPVHEGVGRGVPSTEAQPEEARPQDNGPDERWVRPRLAAAVTGAWLATTRMLFDAAGGFEERLPVAFNDIDFCLRCRAAGLPVAQASDIVAIHRESATRGTAPSPEQQERERAEWAWMVDRWGKALAFDPAFNPHWVRTGHPFDGIAHPSPEAVERWILYSAHRRPWSIEKTDSPQS